MSIRKEVKEIMDNWKPKYEGDRFYPSLPSCGGKCDECDGRVELWADLLGRDLTDEEKDELYLI